MSGASGTLDPVEAARADIAQSRDLIASVADDLHRHQRFLDSYRIAERRHARRLKRQELLYQLGLRWEQFARLARWNALSAARDMRNVYRTLSAATVVALRFVERNASAASAWAAPKLDAANLWLALQAQRLWLACLRAGVAAGTWTAAQMQALWRLFVHTASQAWAWTAREVPIAWQRTVAAASAGAASTDARLRALGQSAASAGAFAARWFRVEFDAAAFATSNAASTTAAWSTRKSRRGAVHAVKLSRRAQTVARDATRTARQSSIALVERAAERADALRKRWEIGPHPAVRVPSRALVVRRSTALVCIAPVRAQLPALQAAPLERRETPPPPAEPRRKPAAKPKAKRKAKAKTRAKRKSKAQGQRKSAPPRRRTKK